MGNRVILTGEVAVDEILRVTERVKVCDLARNHDRNFRNWTVPSAPPNKTPTPCVPCHLTRAATTLPLLIHRPVRRSGLRRPGWQVQRAPPPPLTPHPYTALLNPLSLSLSPSLRRPGRQVHTSTAVCVNAHLGIGRNLCGKVPGRMAEQQRESKISFRQGYKTHPQGKTSGAKWRKRASARVRGWVSGYVRAGGRACVRVSVCPCGGGGGESSLQSICGAGDLARTGSSLQRVVVGALGGGVDCLDNPRRVGVPRLHRVALDGNISAVWTALSNEHSYCHDEILRCQL